MLTEPDTDFALPRTRPSPALGVKLRSMGLGATGTEVISGDASRDPSRDGVGWMAVSEGVERPGDEDLGGFPLAEEAELAAEATPAGSTEGMRPPRISTARAAA